ncbi:MAG: hypothetical protein JSV13_02035 [Nitrospiraceae bacterium]|jgi:hypothetical protein|nr:MAG: hypothetical protein JSV13_02035 [Nitrospiraceae bacterium]
MSSKREICILCAWRENCQKKFSVSGKDMRCPDFAEDITVTKGIPPGKQDNEEEKKK